MVQAAKPISVLVLVLTFVSPARAPAAAPVSAGVNIVGNDDACPSPLAVALALQRLLTHTTVTPTLVDTPAPAERGRTVHIIDLGRRHIVMIEGHRREFVDDLKQCAERAKVAAVFIALVVEPPVVAAPSSPPSPVVTRREPRVDLEVGGLFDIGLSADAEGSLLSGGAVLRLFAGTAHVGAVLSIAGLSPTTLEFTAVSAKLTRVPMALALRGAFDVKRIRLAGDLGLSGTVVIAEGLAADAHETPTGFELGVYAAAMIELWMHRRVAPFLALQAVVAPVPYRLALHDQGVIGHTPYVWIGLSLGVAVKIR